MAPLGKWIAFAFEAILAIPILGGLIIVGNGYTPLIIGFFLHIIVLFFSLKERASGLGNVAGIITAILGWIPFVGWLLHCISAVILFLEALTVSRKTSHRRYS
ncbi:hypothetical protein [Gorillibacterium massiliense]|uniref:hypothetical protein n=1 Tax=Gorillibacterium massiliense TaxID=1280390 RepID=UPI0004ACB61A|nr:hypothetical protein [Gorillibacterium massiliense]